MVGRDFRVVGPDDEAIELAVQEELQVVLFLFGVVFAVSHYRPVALVVEALFKGRLQLGKVGVIDGRENQPHQHRLLFVELAGNCVGAVVKVLHGLVNLINRLLA